MQDNQQATLFWRMTVFFLKRDVISEELPVSEVVPAPTEGTENNEIAREPVNEAGELRGISSETDMREKKRMRFFRGSGPVLLENHIFVIFKGGPDPLSPPLWSAHMHYCRRFNG